MQIEPGPDAWLRFFHRLWTREAPTRGTLLAPAGQLPVNALRRSGLAGWAGQLLLECGDPRAHVLQPDLLRIRSWNTRAMGLLLELLPLLRAEGIAAMPLKGAAFLLHYGKRAYGVRPMSDIDLHVPARHYHRARALLIAEGFTPSEKREDRVTAAWANECGLWTRVSGTWVQIDLHRRFGAWPTLRGLVPLMEREWTEVGGNLLPSPLLMALIVLAHRARALQRDDLRELLDLYHAWQSIDRAAAERYIIEARRLGLWHQHLWALAEIRQHFGPAQLPTQVCAKEESDPWRASAVPELQKRWIHRFGQGSLLELSSAMAIHCGARFIDRLVFRRGRTRWRRDQHTSGGYWHRPA